MRSLIVFRMMLLFLCILSSCAGVDFRQWHLPYMMPVKQGNVLISQINLLKIGMSKKQVRDILGTNVLVSHNECKYLYTVYSNGRFTRFTILELLFDHSNHLIRIIKR